MRASKLTALAATAAFSISLAACGSSDSGSGSGATSDASAAPMMAPSSAPASAMDTAAMNTFGAGCSAVPTDASNPGDRKSVV